MTITTNLKKWREANPEQAAAQAKTASLKGAHTRHHINEGVREPECKFCKELVGMLKRNESL